MADPDLQLRGGGGGVRVVSSFLPKIGGGRLDPSV